MPAKTADGAIRRIDTNKNMNKALFILIAIPFASLKAQNGMKPLPFSFFNPGRPYL